MAHFARVERIDDIYVVTNVVVIANEDTIDSNGVESESVGAEFCRKLFEGGTWVQTSYNHNFRYNFAGIGYIWDEVNQAFYAPPPFESWTLNSNFLWEPPIPVPDEDLDYKWNEANRNWILVNR